MWICPVISGGEVGYLTQVFNHMVVRLREGREALDAANDTLRKKNEELERVSVTDGLTGLYNRRRLMEVLSDEARRSQRLKHTFAVLMVDVDHFKKYNDSFGHLAGDGRAHPGGRLAPRGDARGGLRGPLRR